jgi:prophage tail gpP-like protein
VTLPIASTNTSLARLAIWQVNLRRAKGQRYDCTIQGFYSNKEIWQANTLVQILDDKCQLNGEFLIQGVSYQKSNSGTFTTLSIVNKGAFTLTPATIRSLSSNDFASGLFKNA